MTIHPRTRRLPGAIALVLVGVLTGCGADKPETSTSSVIGRTITDASNHHERSISVITLAKLVTGSDSVYDNPDAESDAWIVVVACGSSHHLERSDVTFGAIPAAESTRSIIAKAKAHDYDTLVPACEAK